MSPVRRAISPATLGIVGALLAASTATAQEVTDSSRQHRGDRARSGAPYRVDSLRVDSTDAAPLTRLSDLLTARLPGLLVQRANGGPASTTGLRLRGVRSVLLRDEPIVVVDGVRLGGEAGFPSPTGDWTAPLLLSPAPLSRLDTLDPEHIERIEVLNGPAAAARYGAGAANGVMLVTTREGMPGRARWTAHSTFGTVHEVTDFPANFAQVGIAPDGSRVPDCSLFSQSNGRCSPVADSLLRYTPFVQESPFSTGMRSTIGLGASAAGERGTVYAGAGYSRESGVLGVDRTRRVDLHANGRLRLDDDLTLAMTAGYTNGALREPTSLLYPDVFMNGLIGDMQHGTGYAIAPDWFRRQPAEGGFGQALASATLNWQHTAWLATATTVGVDRARLTRTDSLGPFPEDTESIIEFQRDAARRTTTTLRTTATTTVGLSPSLRASAVLGVEQLWERVNGSSSLTYGQFPEGGTPRVASQFSEAWMRRSTTAVLAQTQLAWRERLYLTGGVRHERLSYKDWRSETELYPSAGIAWRVSDESWFPSHSPIGTLQLRGAYGVAGQAGYLDVERTSEREIGLDATTFGGRLALGLTSYRQVTKNALFLVPSWTSVGMYAPKAGRVRNSGYELLLRASLFSGESLTWDLTVVGATLANRAVGGPALDDAPFTLLSSRQRVQAGYPLAGYWDRPIVRYADLNGDGIIGVANCPNGAGCEVTLGDTAVYLGSPLPTRRLSITPRVMYRGWLTLTALVDHHGGVMQFNRTRWGRCVYNVCRERQDRSTPLADQASSAAMLLGSFAGYIEDASFWKLREVAVQLHAPERWARAMSATRLTVTLAGRNLATWTRYSGFDPEVTSYEMSPLIRTDNFAQPAARYFLARLDVGW